MVMLATLAPPNVCEHCGSALPTNDPIVRTGPLVIDTEQRRVWVDGDEIRLNSVLEAGILVCLALRIGRIAYREDILTSVWGGIQYRTEYHLLRVNMTRLRQHLGPARELISTWHCRGFLLRQVDPCASRDIPPLPPPVRFEYGPHLNGRYRPYLEESRLRVYRALKALPPEGGPLNRFLVSIGGSNIGLTRERVSRTFTKFRSLGAEIQVTQARHGSTGWVQMTRGLPDWIVSP